MISESEYEDTDALDENGNVVVDASGKAVKIRKKIKERRVKKVVVYEYEKSENSGHFGNSDSALSDVSFQSEYDEYGERLPSAGQYSVRTVLDENGVALTKIDENGNVVKITRKVRANSRAKWSAQENGISSSTVIGSETDLELLNDPDYQPEFNENGELIKPRKMKKKSKKSRNNRKNHENSKDGDINPTTGENSRSEQNSSLSNYDSDLRNKLRNEKVSKRRELAALRRKEREENEKRLKEEARAREQAIKDSYEREEGMRRAALARVKQIEDEKLRKEAEMRASNDFAKMSAHEREILKREREKEKMAQFQQERMRAEAARKMKLKLESEEKERAKKEEEELLAGMSEEERNEWERRKKEEQEKAELEAKRVEDEKKRAFRLKMAEMAEKRRRVFAKIRVQMTFDKMRKDTELVKTESVALERFQRISGGAYTYNTFLKK